MRQKKILVVDDDEHFLKPLVENLTNAGYEVVSARDGLEAFSTFDDSFVAVVSDIQMAYGDGVELIVELRKRSTVPILLMTGFTELIDMKTAFDLGADEFLLKPFNVDDLVECLDRSISNNDPTMLSHNPQFCAVSAEEITNDKILISDVYVRLDDNNKYLKAGKEGGQLNKERIEPYRSKDLDCFYVRREDYYKYIGIHIPHSSNIDPNSEGRLDKVERITISMESALKRCYLDGLDKEKFIFAEQIVETAMATILNDEDATDAIEFLNAHSNIAFSHSVGVSLFAPLIAKEAKLTEHKTLFYLALGGLFHNIGKKEIPMEILEKPRMRMTESERKLFESHPTKGKDLLSNFNWVPEEIIKIAYHHHENEAGHGYPNGLNRDEIHPLAKIISIADEFCKLTVRSHVLSNTMSPHDAIDRLYKFYSEELCSQYLVALMNLFDYPIPAKLVAPTQ